MDRSVKLSGPALSTALESTAAHVPLREGNGPETPRAAAVGSRTGSAESALQVGQTFGDFEVLAELGRGAMGIVYKARQISLDRPVALKVLPVGPNTTATLRARFVAEARACAALTHPNIPTFYQTGDSPAGPYCALEFIDGQTLDVLIEDRVVSVASAVGLLYRVAGAVHHAHTKGIIHRDLKPGNIMLDKANRPVVMDFGLAKLLEKSAGLTMEGDIMGTPAYMAPEQARGNVALIGPASDVYSLGAILYRLLTGQPPYGEQRALETILKLTSAEPPPSPRTLRPEIPETLEQICMKCLRKDQTERYPSADDLSSELRRFRAALPAPRRGPATMRPLAMQGALHMTWTEKQVPLTDGPIVIGRDADCDVELPALTVSGRHCRIVVDSRKGVVEAEDLGSASGTMVNGRRVKRCQLQDGDRLDVGGYVFQVRLSKRKVV